MDYTVLSNGLEVPLLGLGTFLMNEKEAGNAVYYAIKNGYRLFDTANAYMNETGVGLGICRSIEEGVVRREDILVSTKIWPTLYESETAVEETLKRLGLDYVDILFIHQPAGHFLKGYRLLEKAYKDGKARAIGVSNFQGTKLDTILQSARIPPHVIQTETHPYYIDHETLNTLEPYGTKLMGWYPLGHGNRELLSETVFEKLSEINHKSPVREILRWSVQKGFITIPGSRNPDNIRENIDIFDFILTDEEMASIETLDQGKRYYHPTPELEEIYGTMHLPCEKVKNQG